MAIIIPYGDINAHGSLGGSVSFRRRFGRVIFQKKPHPVQPNTAGQLAQRLAFKNASESWNFLNAPSKPFYQDRGSMLGMTGRNLWTQANLLPNLPTTTVINIRKIEAMQILSPVGAGPASGSWTVHGFYPSGPGWDAFGQINDNANNLISVSEFIKTYTKIRITGKVDPSIPFRYGFSMSIKDQALSIWDIIVLLPTQPNITTEYFISDDGSAYFDDALTELACTGIM
jgi:hypothetical protein